MIVVSELLGALLRGRYLRAFVTGSLPLCRPPPLVLRVTLTCLKCSGHW
jgi:hypothetical protein